MLKESHKLLHWNYFLALESDLEQLSRYVEFTEDNYNTYSLEMAHMLLAASSEADVVLKSLCKKVNPTERAENILDYQKILTLKIPKLRRMKIRLPRYGLEIKPWENWKNQESPPDWWTAYNKVKHKRDEHYDLAKLQNTVASMAGLFVLVFHLYKEEAENGTLVPLPRIMAPPQECIRALKQSDFGISLVYKL